MRAADNAQPRAPLALLLAVGVWAVLLLEQRVWKGGLVRLPIPLGGAGGLPVPLLYWLSIAGYAWVYGRQWARAARLAFGLHALVLIAALAREIAGNPQIALSRWYLLYWHAFWVAALAAGAAGIGWAVIQWRRTRNAEPRLFFLPLLGGYLTLCASAAVMPARLTIAAVAAGLALLALPQAAVRRLRDRLANERLFLSLVALAALALRLFYTIRVMSGPAYLSTGSDGPIYDALAWKLVHPGAALAEPLPWWAAQFFSPGYVQFVALMYRLAGRSYFAVCAVQSVFGAAACVLIYAVAKRLFGRNVARLSAIFGVVSFPMVFAAASLGHQAMDLVWTLAVVWCLLQYLDDPARRGRWIAGIGLLLGWAALTREGNMVFWAFLIGWFLLGMRIKVGGRRALLHAAGLSLGVVLMLLPFLWGGGGGIIERLAHIWFYYPHTSTPINAWFNPWRDPQAAWALLQQQPMTVLWKVGEAMLGNFTALFLQQGYGSFDPVFLVKGSAYYAGMWFYALLLACVGLGLVCRGAMRRPMERLDWWLIIIVLVSRTAVHLVLASAYRYRVALEPYLIMLAALAAMRLARPEER